MMTRRDVIKLFLTAVSEGKARKPPEPPPAFEGILISDIEVGGERLQSLPHPTDIVLRRVPDGDKEVFETHLNHKYGLAKTIAKFKYVVIRGHDRLLALQKLGHSMIVCKVIS